MKIFLLFLENEVKLQKIIILTKDFFANRV